MMIRLIGAAVLLLLGLWLFTGVTVGPGGDTGASTPRLGSASKRPGGAAVELSPSEGGRVDDRAPGPRDFGSLDDASLPRQYLQYPHLDGQLHRDGVPLADLDFDALEAESLLALHRDVRDLAQTVGLEHLQRKPGWESLVVSRSDATKGGALDPDSFFLKVSRGAGGAFTHGGYVELLGTMPVELVELRDLSRELTSLPTLVARRRFEGARSSTGGPSLEIAVWEESADGRTQFGYSEAGMLITQVAVVRVGAP